MMYKIINFIVKSVLFLIVLANLSLYAFYQYKLQAVDLSVYKKKIDYYKSDYYVLLWLQPSRRNYPNDIEMKPIYLVYNEIEQYVFDRYKGEKSPSATMAYWLSRWYDIGGRREFLQRYVIQVWISHHLTFEEASCLLLEQLYFGHGFYGIKAASQGYFGKEPNALNLYEIMMLIALTKAPSTLDPIRQPKKLMVKMYILMFKLYKTFPAYYYPTLEDYKKALKSNVIAKTVDASILRLQTINDK